jgi:hypothetical protein
MAAKTYHGKPCKVCGGTERFANGHLTCRGRCDENSRTANQRYNKSDKGRATHDRYNKTERGQLLQYFRHVNHEIKRKRERAEIAARKLGLEELIP